jgi:uncharacterized protein YndB with AHSA1/START domain
MSKRSIAHATFVIERVYDAPPARVFQAFADLESKKKWFKGPDEWTQHDGWKQEQHVMDFRVGGKEHVGGGPKGGPIHRFDATYYEIIPNERIIYTYEMHMNDTRISVSVATFELRAEGKGTKLVLTEMGAFLDGHDNVSQREHGTNWLIDRLGESLNEVPATA